MVNLLSEIPEKAMPRLPITKTHKLFIGGKFPRTESGRSTHIAAPTPTDAGWHVCRASRKDLRNAVEAATKAQPAWANANAYLRGQVLYRLAEMMEGKRAELAAAVAPGTTEQMTTPGDQETDLEVSSAIDRVVHYAGWCDKYAQVAGCANPVAGPYHNFTFPEPIGVVGVIAPDIHPLLALVSLIAPAICVGNAVVALASETNPIAACVLAEAIATSDMPGGIINILTGFREELVPHFASHREIGAIHAANIEPEHGAALREGVAENLKRVTIRDAIDFNSSTCDGPDWIEPLTNLKTLWHPSAS